MSVTANVIGTATGKFTIPAGIPAGVKSVRFVGASGSEATATFIGDGQRTVETRRAVSRPPFTVARRIDPLAQTFTLPEPKQIAAIDLWFTTGSASPVDVQIRETFAGVPTQVIVAATRLEPGDIVTGGGHTRAVLPYPVPHQNGVEYALVVLSADPNVALAVAELGKQDSNTGQWVTAQPYQVGVLLSSSNASTWTPHQDRDLAFRLLEAGFSENQRTIELGSVDVVGATDLIVRANVESPASAATCRFALTMPDSTVHYLSAEQLLRLNTPVTGTIDVSAILNGNTGVSPILHRDVQLIWGVVGLTGDYVGRSIEGGSSVKVRIVVEVQLPGTSSVTASFKGLGDPSWTALGAAISTKTMQDGWLELTFESASVTKTSLRPKLTLSGSSQYRPQARNLRAIVI